MASSEYLDFDLMIERTGDHTYRARVLSSPAGQAVGDFSIPFSELETENFLLRLSRPRRGVRRIDSPGMETVKKFGGALFKSVFEDELMSALRSSLEDAQKQNAGLRIRLRLNDAPELVNLPWEYLYNPSLNRFLSLSVNTPMVRYLELPERIAPLTVSLPLRILVVISSPTDYPQLDVEMEWTNLKSAIRGLEENGQVILERLESASPVDLQYQLRRNDYHIFHFVGHGSFNEQAQDGILLFEDENKRGRQLSGQYLGTLLHDEKTLRLAVLNACEGAISGSIDPFAGVAQSLVQQGVPAVIAMQREITDDAAITFAREFYTAIAEGFPVDGAMSESRKAIFSLGNDIEWGTPVLYMRAPDGHIFDVSKIEQVVHTPDPSLTADPIQPASKLNAAELETLYIDGLSAYWLKDWARAWEHFRQIEEVDPNYKDLTDKLVEVKSNLTISTLQTEADQAVRDKNWTTAIGALEKLVELLPNDNDLAARLKNTKEDAQLDSLYTQAQELYEAGQWEAVCSVFDQIKAIQPNYPDPTGMLVKARTELENSKREHELESLYARGLNAMEGGHWEEASQAFQQIKQIDSHYRDTSKHLKTANAKLAAQRSEKAETLSAEPAMIKDEAKEETHEDAHAEAEVKAELERSQVVPATMHSEADATNLPQPSSRAGVLSFLDRLGLPRWAVFLGVGIIAAAVILTAVFIGGGARDSMPEREILQEPVEAALAVENQVEATATNAPAPTQTPEEILSVVDESHPTPTKTKNPTPTEKPIVPTKTTVSSTSNDPSERSGPYENYVVVRDDTGSIQFEIPSAWSDITSWTWEDELNSLSFTAPTISAAANLDNYWDGYDESGVSLSASKRLAEITGIAGLKSHMQIWDCYKAGTYTDEPDVIEKYQGTVEWAQDGLANVLNPVFGWANYSHSNGWSYDDSVYEGTFDLFICDPNNSIVVIWTGRPKANPTAYLIGLEMIITDDYDFEALDHILKSLEVDF